MSVLPTGFAKSVRGSETETERKERGIGPLQLGSRDQIFP